MTQLGTYLRGALRKASKILAVLAEDERAPAPEKPRAVKPAAPVAPATPVCCGKAMNRMVSPNSYTFTHFQCAVCGGRKGPDGEDR
jgi:hypothetical protein